jgi:hypothetical protein
MSVKGEAVSLKSGRGRRRPLRLMVHAVDGCVPYMTPFLLEKHFPPSEDFLVGIKVSDTCIVPVFGDNSGKKQKKKTKSNKEDTSADDDGVKSNSGQVESQSSNNNNNNKDTLKHRGYSFGSIAPDSWLLPYNRVTVPTFNLVQDNLDRQQNADVASANNQVSVWTPNGKQALTPDLYENSASGLHSKYCVSLFDMSSEPSRRRQEKALARTTEWLMEFVAKQSEDASAAGGLWAPVLIPPASIKSLEQTVTISLDHITSHKDAIAGIALVGSWQPDLDGILKAVDVENVAMLSTSSLDEILHIASSDCINVIGTDLPRRWAKEKKAFVVSFGALSTNNEDSLELDENGCLDLSDTKFARDASPLINGCSCMACNDNTFGRDYIHHLVCAKEMLAEILLYGHNLHHLLEMIRAFSSSNDVNGMKIRIKSQLKDR